MLHDPCVTIRGVGQSAASGLRIRLPPAPVFLKGIRGKLAYDVVGKKPRIGVARSRGLHLFKRGRYERRHQPRTTLIGEKVHRRRSRCDSHQRATTKRGLGIVTRLPRPLGASMRGSNLYGQEISETAASTRDVIRQIEADVQR